MISSSALFWLQFALFHWLGSQITNSAILLRNYCKIWLFATQDNNFDYMSGYRSLNISVDCLMFDFETLDNFYMTVLCLCVCAPAHVHTCIIGRYLFLHKETNWHTPCFKYRPSWSRYRLISPFLPGADTMWENRLPYRLLQKTESPDISPDMK